MWTEPNTRREPTTRPRMRRVSPARWLKALRDPQCVLEIGRVILGHAHAGWTTQVRVGDSYTWRNYLFWPENVPIEVETNSKRLVVPPKALVWLSPGVHYSLRARQAVWLARVRFRLWQGQTLLRMWTEPNVVPGMIRFGETAQRLYEEYRIAAPFADDRFRALVGDLSVNALRTMQHETDSGRRLTHHQASRLLSYMVEHVAERPTPNDLAALLRLSPAYFARLFRGTFGVSARRWIVEERIRHAARLLLETDDNVGEVARALGYEDQHFFSRQFRSVHRLSPLAYRQAHPATAHWRD